MEPGKFSDQLEKWLRSRQPKTLQNLSDVFGEKSFAVFFLILMFLPSLPLPTGGITHFFEILTMLLAIELIIARDKIWIPRWAKNHSLGKVSEKKVLPFMLRRIRTFERFSRPRLADLMSSHRFGQYVGMVVLVFAIAAFFAPPFSGLDTLPSFGIVAISLALILGDGVLFLLGLLSGTVGITLMLAFGAAIAKAVQSLVQ